VPVIALVRLASRSPRLHELELNGIECFTVPFSLHKLIERIHVRLSQTSLGSAGSASPTRLR
jgi:DNA-binding response OmpR family regulator